MTSRDSSEINLFLAQKSQALEQSSSRSFLAIDSSTQLASVAVSFQGKIIFAEECVRQKSHSEWINGALERAVTVLPKGWQSLELISLVHGPGSFTGLRVATNVARTIAYVHNLPVVSMSSLETLAHQVELEGQESIFILPLINAFKNMVFGGVYYKSQSEFKTIVPPQSIEVDHLSEVLSTLSTRVNKSVALSSDSAIEKSTHLSEGKSTDFPVGSFGHSFLEVLSVSDPAFESIFNSNKNHLLSKKIMIVGDGVETYQSVLQPLFQPPFFRPLAPKDFPLATTVAERINQGWGSLPLMHWKELTPVYLRASAAEELARTKKS